MGNRDRSNSLFIKHLILHHFRNYEHAEVSFSPAVNIFCGNNGSGKTNLLEAIYLICTGRSFRTKSLSELIRIGSSYFYLEGHFERDGISQCIKIFYDDKQKKIQHNHTLYSNFSSLLGAIPITLLSPEDHVLITGSPADRRKFIDLHIAQIDPLYVYHLGRYLKGVKQRNHLIRTKNLETLRYWEKVLSPSAAYIMIKRRESIAHLSSAIDPWMRKLSSNKESLSAAYESNTNVECLEEKALSDILMQKWEKIRAKELYAGTTLLGPHRDDLAFHISEKEAKSFSSEGQKRGSMIAMRFAQAELIQTLTGIKPVLGIDDFDAHLDLERKTFLKTPLEAFGQVFLTTPNPSDSNKDKQIHVEMGRLSS